MKPISEHPEHQRIMKELTGLSDVRAKVQTKLAEIEQRLLERPIPGGDAARVDAAREFAATGVVKAPAGDSSALHEEHTASGAHRVHEQPFPDWVPVDIAEAARQLTDAEALAQLPACLSGLA